MFVMMRKCLCIFMAGMFLKYLISLRSNMFNYTFLNDTLSVKRSGKLYRKKGSGILKMRKP